MREIVAWGEAVTAVVFILLFIRIVYVLSASSIGDLLQELLYLRAGDLKAPLTFLLSALVLQVLWFLVPILDVFHLVRGADTVGFYVTAVEAVLLLAGAILMFIVLQRYTHRGIDRRIRESMETLAYLAGQRRRRARARGEEPNPRPADRRGRDFE